MSKRTRPDFYYFANWALRHIFRVVLDLDVRGLENVPREGGLIVAISHSSFVDPEVVGAMLPRDIAPMAKVEAFDTPVLGWIVKSYGAFPVRRGEVDVTAFKTAIQILKAGEAMVIAPEGHRSDNGSLQRGREGAIMLSLRTGAPILPVAVWGGKALWKNLARLHRTAMWLSVSEPVLPDVSGGKPTRAQMGEMADELMVRIAVMMPPEIRGYYSDLSRVTTHHLQPVRPTLAGKTLLTKQKEVIVR